MQIGVISIGQYLLTYKWLLYQAWYTNVFQYDFFLWFIIINKWWHAITTPTNMCNHIMVIWSLSVI